MSKKTLIAKFELSIPQDLEISKLTGLVEAFEGVLSVNIATLR